MQSKILSVLAVIGTILSIVLFVFPAWMFVRAWFPGLGDAAAFIGTLVLLMVSVLLDVNRTYGIVTILLFAIFALLNFTGVIGVGVMSESASYAAIGSFYMLGIGLIIFILTIICKKINS